VKEFDRENDSGQEREKLVQLGVDRELLKNLTDEQVTELISALYYLIIKTRNGWT
jgi:hypothetical protein